MALCFNYHSFTPFLGVCVCIFMRMRVHAQYTCEGQKTAFGVTTQMPSTFETGPLTDTELWHTGQVSKPVRFCGSGSLSPILALLGL